MSLTETGFCFSPSDLRNAASSKVSSGGGVRLRLAALGFPCGVRNGMQALYTKRGVRSRERRQALVHAGVQCLKKDLLFRQEAYREEIFAAVNSSDAWTFRHAGNSASSQ